MINNPGVQIISIYNQGLRDTREGVWEVDYHPLYYWSFLQLDFKGKVRGVCVQAIKEVRQMKQDIGNVTLQN